MFTCDACFRPSTTIKSHNLHVGDIRGAMGEIASYHNKDWLSPFLWACLWPPSFGLPWNGSGRHYLIF